MRPSTEMVVAFVVLGIAVAVVPYVFDRAQVVERLAVCVAAPWLGWGLGRAINSLRARRAKGPGD